MKIEYTIPPCSVVQNRGDIIVLYPLSDNLGTVRDIVDLQGDTAVIVNHIVYDTFGNVISQTDASFSTLYGYTGRERDDESDLYFYRARYYDPALGLFVSQDPIAFASGDTNLYRYVGNSPTNAADPSGLEEVYGPMTWHEWQQYLEQHREAREQALRENFGYDRLPNSLSSDAMLTDATAGGLITSFSLLPRPQLATMTFYRGMTYGAAHEVVSSQAFDVSRIASLQAHTCQPRTGIYLSTQEATARYWAGIAGYRGRGLGPAVVKIEVPQARFARFAKANSIPVETPVARMPGQTETLIPFNKVQEFESMATLSHAGTAAKTSAMRSMALSAGRMAKGTVVQAGGELLLDNFMHPDGIGGYHMDYSAGERAKAAQMERIRAEGREPTFAEAVSVPGPGGIWYGSGPAPPTFAGLP